MMKFSNLILALMVSSSLLHNTAYALDIIPDDITAWTERGIVLSTGATGSWDEKKAQQDPSVFIKRTAPIIYIIWQASRVAGMQMMM